MLSCIPGALRRRSVIRLAPALIAAVVAAGCGRKAEVSSPTPAAPTPEAAAPARQSIAITDGESLIRAMYARYENKWYHTMTFAQRTTTATGGSTPRIETWYEAMSLPGNLRIDVGNPEGGNGFLFRRDSTYQFSNGRPGPVSTRWNELLVLGFDVYTQPPDVTISILRSLGYQLSRMRMGDLDYKTVYVIGTNQKNDSTSKQFWVERERLVFVRSQEKNPSGRQIDIRFSDYVPAKNGWVARQVFQYVDGAPRLHEEYSGISTDPVLDPGLFDPKQWSTAKHWLKK